MFDSNINSETPKATSKPKIFLLSILFLTVVTLMVVVLATSLNKNTNTASDEIVGTPIDPNTVAMLIDTDIADTNGEVLDELPATGVDCRNPLITTTPLPTCAPTPRLSPTATPIPVTGVPVYTKAPSMTIKTPTPAPTNRPQVLYTPYPSTTVESKITLTITNNGHCQLSVAKYVVNQDIMYFQPNSNIRGGQGQAAWEFPSAYDTKMSASKTYYGESMQMFQKYTVYQRNRVTLYTTNNKIMDLGTYYSNPLHANNGGTTTASKDIVIPCK